MRLFIPFLSILCFLAFTADSYASERNRSGTYQSNRGSGSWQQKATRDGQGNLNRSSTWQNQRGEGSSNYNRNWDKDSGTGSSNRTTTNAAGQTATTNKNFVRNQDGSGGTVTGSRTGYKGGTQDLNKTYTTNEDGSKTVNTTVNGTSPAGETKSYSSTKTFNTNE